MDPETQDVIEVALTAYAEEFAALCGADVGTIRMLDSVGGAYAFTPPEATLPIAGLFDDDADARGRVMEAFTTRSDEWLEVAWGQICDRIDGAADVLDPDWCNNKNRLYKAPLSIHGKYDGIVTSLVGNDR